jgi:hypothetical protein
LRRELLASGARADCARLEQLLDPDTSSSAPGRGWSRHEMIAELLESSELGDVDI